MQSLHEMIRRQQGDILSCPTFFGDLPPHHCALPGGVSPVETAALVVGRSDLPDAGDRIAGCHGCIDYVVARLIGETR